MKNHIRNVIKFRVPQARDILENEQCESKCPYEKETYSNDIFYSFRKSLSLVFRNKQAFRFSSFLVILSSLPKLTAVTVEYMTMMRYNSDDRGNSPIADTAPAFILRGYMELSLKRLSNPSFPAMLTSRINQAVSRPTTMRAPYVLF